MPVPKANTPPDFDTLSQQLLTQLGSGVIECETPQLGRVGFARPAELYQALNYLRIAQAAAAGSPPTGVIVIGFDRGLWPQGGC